MHSKNNIESNKVNNHTNSQKDTNIQISNLQIPQIRGGGGESYLISQVFTRNFFKKCFNIKDNENTQNTLDSPNLRNLQASQNPQTTQKSKTDSTYYNIFSIAFFVYVIFISFLCLSLGSISFLSGDDWAYSAEYKTYYNPLEFKHAFDGTMWQRGRHIADVFMTFTLRPIGEFLISFGVDVLSAFKIMTSFFTLCFFMLTFIAFSIVVWWLNDKRDFRLIFVLVSLFIISMLKIAHFVAFAAYFGSAGFCMILFLPILHYFLFNKEYKYSNNIGVNLSVILVLVYCASFQLETSSLIIFGLSIFIAFYYFISRFYNKGQNLSFTFKYYLTLFIILIPLSVLMTTFSGRGRRQREVMSDFTYKESFLRYIKDFFNDYGFLEIKLWIEIALILFVGILIYMIIKKKVSKKLYIQFALLSVGIIGMIGFSTIRVPNFYFEFILLMCVIFSFILPFRESKNAIFSILSNGICAIVIFVMLFAVVRNYEEEFAKRAPYKDSVATLIKIFQDAEKNNQDAIFLTNDDIEKYKLKFHHINPPKDNPKEYNFPNDSISYWMLHYGFTAKFIKIYLLKDKNE